MKNKLIILLLIVISFVLILNTKLFISGVQLNPENKLNFIDQKINIDNIFIKNVNSSQKIKINEIVRNSIAIFRIKGSNCSECIKH